jgi:hypothetical protein
MIIFYKAVNASGITLLDQSIPGQYLTKAVNPPGHSFNNAVIRHPSGHTFTKVIICQVIIVLKPSIRLGIPLI